MELLCTTSHSMKVVIAGQFYPFISDKSPCNCKQINVGIKQGPYTWIQTTNVYPVGTPIRCTRCNKIFYNDGFHWLSPTLFGIIGTQETTWEKEQQKKDYASRDVFEVIFGMEAEP